MLGGLITFLVGALVLAAVLYIASLVLDSLTLPPNVRQIALVALGLLGLIALVVLTVRAFPGVGLDL